MSTNYPETIGLHLSYVRGISVEEKLTHFFVVFCAKRFGDQDVILRGPYKHSLVIFVNRPSLRKIRKTASSRRYSVLHPLV